MREMSAVGVLQMARTNRARWLYRNEGRFTAETRDVNRDRLWEVGEAWLTIHLDEQHYSRIAQQRCLYGGGRAHSY
jgi:hypothetical protein